MSITHNSMDASHNKLPVLTILLMAANSLWQLRDVLLAKNGVPLIILIVLSAVDSLLPESSTGLSILVFILLAFVQILFIVNSHRIVLLGNDSVPNLGLRLFSKREWRFVGWLIAIYLLLLFSVAIVTTGSTLTSSFIGIYGAYALFGAVISIGFYVFSRLSPILPATAADYDPDIYWAWAISSDNGWRLVLIICIVPFITGSAIEYIEGLSVNIFTSAIKDFIYFIVLIFEVFALSLSFKYLNENNSNKSLVLDAPR